MLEEVLRHLNNRFERARVDGSFSIEGGALEVPGALDGQYVWVEGSTLNDGLHRYPAEGLDDEEFDGTVWLLAVPRAVSELADEIEAWKFDNAKVLDSPLESESFGGYSYKKASSGNSGGGDAQAAWQAQFGPRLRHFRKLYRDWV